jgi:ribulose-bisphosphate carboxylase large chain
MLTLPAALSFPIVSRILATYRFVAPPGEAGRVAEALALEQSVEVPAQVVRDPFVAREVMAQVADLRSDGEVHRVTLALATATTGHDVAQTLNMLFGNVSLQPHVELVEVAFPPEVLAGMPGPRFGIAGIRRLLGVTDRPLACAALKPQGLAPDALAALCHTLAIAGIDVIKDDHGLADQAYAPFAARVAACQQAVARASATLGRRIAYAPSLVGSPRRLREQARVARDLGAAMVLVAPALAGLPAFAELIGELEVPVLGHPAFAGATRIAPPLMLGRLFRLLGADAVIFPHAGGRFSYDLGTCRAIAAAARDPWPPIASALPVPAGGMSVAQVPAIVDCYGNDTMLLIGGSLLLDPGRVAERAREFAERVQAAEPATSSPQAAA